MQSNVEPSQGGRRYRSTNVRRPWMANLAVSLIFISLVSSSLPLKLPSVHGETTLNRRTLSRRDTNPPFPVYSDEAEPPPTDEEIVTTTAPRVLRGQSPSHGQTQSQGGNSESQEEERTTTIKPPPRKTHVFMNSLLRRPTNSTNSLQSKKSDSVKISDQDLQPTQQVILGHSSSSSSSWEEDGESAEESVSGTHSTLLSPLPTRPTLPTPTSTRSNHVTNSTSHNNHNANMNLFRRNNNSSNNHNDANAIATNNIRGESVGNESSNPNLRGARPTTSVIQFNPGSYNRVVKRKKITSISGKVRNGDSDVPQTTTSSVELGNEELPSATDNQAEDMFSEAATTLRTIAYNHGGHHQNGSRAIAGFSKKGPVRVVVTKSRPKPIIIRDHEAYFRNLTTEMIPTTENSLVEEDTAVPPTVASPIYNNNLLENGPHHNGNNLKVRKVKVTMGRRPGPGVLGTVTSDHPVQAVTEGNSVTTIKLSTTTTTTTPTTTSEPPRLTTTSGPPAQETNNNVNQIRPSPSSSTPEEVTSRRVFKEEYGIHRDSYNEADPGHMDDDVDGFSSTMEDDDHDDDHHSHHSNHDDSDHHSVEYTTPSSMIDMEEEATTEHYYTVHIPKNRQVATGNGNDARFGNFRFEGSGSDGSRGDLGDEHDTGSSPPRLGHVRVSSTPKYRDYFSEVPIGADKGQHIDSHNKDNLNHLYMNGGGNDSREVDGIHIDPSPSPSPTEPGTTVAATRTLSHFDTDISPTPTPGYNVSNIEFQIPAPVVEANSHSQHEIPPSSSFTTTTTATPHLPLPLSPVNSVEAPHSSNSVEEHPERNNGSVGHSEYAKNGLNISTPTSTDGPKISSKDTTSVFYTKVEQPHFTSSSYEYSTTKEYSYTSHHDEEHPHDHSHPENEDRPTSTPHPPENSAAESQNHNLNTNISVITFPSPPSPTPFFTVSNNVTVSSTSVATTTTTKATAAPSSQIPIVIVAPKNLTTPVTAVTENNLPEISHNDISQPDEDKRNKTSADDGNENELDQRKPSLTNGLPTVVVPALYQVPVLVRFEVQLAQAMFCSNIQNFKEMIVLVYGESKSGILDPNQIVIYIEPNCTTDIVPPTENSSENPTTLAPALVKSTTVTTPQNINITTASTIVSKVTFPPAKNDSSEKPNSGSPVLSNNGTESEGGETTSKPGNKTLPSRRRRRRQIHQQQIGESLILDKKSSSRNSGINGFNLSQIPNQKNSTSSEPQAKGEIVSVYFYVKDKFGNYDQELTMSFYEFWNQSQSLENGNGSWFQGVFYQRIKKVEMVSASQLLSPEDAEGNENSGVITAIAIASIAATCLFLIGVLLLVLRHRQSQTKFAKRCTPVTLDDYSLDNISFSNSFRRKQRLRGSKRSYTNAAFDDHTAPSRVVNSATLHTALTDTSGLDAEFRAIPNVTPTLDDLPQGAEGILAKNRYANVIPMPDSRVLLTFQEEQPNSDYINANFVRGENGEQKRYIITQGPLEETVVDFWRMVWEQQVRVIFMLTDFAEAGHPKCAEYYPRSETIDCSQLHGDFQVTLEKRDITDNSITSYLVIKDMERNLRRDVIHLWYHSWPEKGVPPSAKPTVDFLLKSRKFTKELTPIVVHCSPGTGRSGTLVACDIAMKEFTKSEKVDIPRLVLRCRQDRAGSVQTKEQYLHIYEALHYYATRYAATQMDPNGIP